MSDETTPAWFSDEEQEMARLLITGLQDFRNDPETSKWISHSAEWAKSLGYGEGLKAEKLILFSVLAHTAWDSIKATLLLGVETNAKKSAESDREAISLPGELAITFIASLGPLFEHFIRDVYVRAEGVKKLGEEAQAFLAEQPLPDEGTEDE